MNTLTAGCRAPLIGNAQLQLLPSSGLPSGGRPAGSRAQASEQTRTSNPGAVNM